MTYKEAAVKLSQNENLSIYSLDFLEKWIKDLYSLESNKLTLEQVVKDLISFSEQFIQTLNTEG